MIFSFFCSLLDIFICKLQKQVVISILRHPRLFANLKRHEDYHKAISSSKMISSFLSLINQSIGYGWTLSFYALRLAVWLGM